MSVQEKTKEIDTLIENAKWDIYGEEWGSAITKLNTARKMAISMKDKARIDIILNLHKKAVSQQRINVP